MVIINNNLIYAFDAEQVFFNANSSYNFSKYQSLLVALRHSKINLGADKLTVGDEIKTTTEYYDFPKNILILLDIKQKQYFQIIKDSIIGECLENVDDIDVFDFFYNEDFCVMDNYGKLLNIENHEELKQFINTIKANRESIKDKTDLSNKYSEKLEKLRRMRAISVNQNLGEDFNKMLSVANAFESEIKDILSETIIKTHEDFINKYSKIPESIDTRLTNFGLYIAVLKSFIKSKYAEVIDFNSVDYIVYLSFLKEFNNFYKENNDILSMYNECYHLRKIEQTALKTLLDSHKINGKDWVYNPSDLEI